MVKSISESIAITQPALTDHKNTNNTKVEKRWENSPAAVDRELAE